MHPLIATVFIIFSPNQITTPGDLCDEIDYDFEEFRYDEEIPYCHRNVSETLKNTIYNNYNIPLKTKYNYTIDHLIPLSLGGSNDITNLWPEHKDVKATRPNLEWDLYWDIKNGRITQIEGIEIILRAKFNPEI